MAARSVGTRAGAGLLSIFLAFSFQPLAVGLAPTALAVTGTTVYVSAATGNDSTGDGTSGNPYATIQKGIDSALDGDTVSVASGTYAEQLFAKDRSLTIVGAAGATITLPNPSDLGYPTAGLTATGTLDPIMGSSLLGRTYLPMVFIDGGTVTLDGFDIDGSGVPRTVTSDPGARFVQVFFVNASGGVRNSTLHDLVSDPAYANWNKIGLIAWVLTPSAADVGPVAPQTVTVEANTFENFESDALWVRSNEGAKPGSGYANTITFDVLDNVFTGAGPRSDRAQNGIQYGSGADAPTNAMINSRVEGNTFTDMWWLGNESYGDTTSNDAGLSLFFTTGTIDVVGNTFTNVQGGVNFNAQQAGSFVGNTFGWTSIPTLYPDQYDYAVWAENPEILIANNLISYDHVGIYRAGQATGSATNRVFENSFAISPYAGDVAPVAVSTGDTTPIDATGNWWGTDIGPAVGQVSANVTTDPWIATWKPDPRMAGKPGFWPEVPVTASVPANSTGEVVGDHSIGSPSLSFTTGDEPVTVTIAPYTPAAGELTGAPFAVGDADSFFDISITSGSATGPFTICVATASPERLWHYDGSPAAWVDVTNAPPDNYVDGKTCGTVETLSPFVTAPNDAPTADDVTAGTTADYSVEVTLAGHDLNGDALDFAIVTGPTNGSLGTIGTPACTGTVPNDCTAGVTYTPTASWTGTDTFTYSVTDGTDSSTATATITVSPRSETTIVYVGPLLDADGDGSTTLVARLGSADSACIAGKTIEFWIDVPTAWTYLGSATTVTDGTATYTWTHDPGLDANFGVLVMFDGDAQCLGASAGDGTVAIALPGDSAYGGGWYRPGTPGVRDNFGFAAQKKILKGVTTYRGQMLWIQRHAYRLKGTVTTIGAMSCPAGFVKCAKIGGTATLWTWVPDIEAPDGGYWSNPITVSYLATVYDGGTSTTCVKKACTTKEKPDAFGISITAVNAAGESVPVVLSGGSIKVN